jgi:hypothetical protein
LLNPPTTANALHAAPLINEHARIQPRQSFSRFDRTELSRFDRTAIARSRLRGSVGRIALPATHPAVLRLDIPDR